MVFTTRAWNPYAEKNSSDKPKAEKGYGIAEPSSDKPKAEKGLRHSRIQRGQAEDRKGSFGIAEPSSDKPKAEKGLRHSRTLLG